VVIFLNRKAVAMIRNAKHKAITIGLKDFFIIHVFGVKPGNMQKAVPGVFTHYVIPLVYN